MQSKTLRFTSEDQKKFDLIKNELSESMGIDTDIGIIRFLVSQYLFNKKKPAPEKEEEKEKPIPEEVQKDLDEYMANPTEHFCINHPNILQSKCECFTNGNMLQGLLRFHGYPHNTKYD